MMKNSKEKNKNYNVMAGLASAKAITLITLVITIVILIILASITINLALSDSGLFSKTKQASTQYDTASTREKIETAVLTSQISGNYDASVDTSILETELINTCGITASDITKSDATGSLPWTVNANGYVFTISATGAVTVGSSISDDSEEVEPEPTEIYVALYWDGTLTFYSSEVKIEEDMERDLTMEYYENIRGNSYSSFSGVPWHNDWDEITKIKFADEIYPTSTAHWFEGLSEVDTIENIENLKTSLVTDMSYMFSEFGSSTFANLDLSGFDTSNVTNMSEMFYRCEINSLNISNFNTSKVTNMKEMFDECTVSALDVSSFDTSSVTDMSYMFAWCSVNSIDVSNFNTSNVTKMWDMFGNMTNISQLDLRSFDTRNTDTASIFENCLNLTEVIVSSSKWVTGEYTFESATISEENLRYVD